MKKIVFITLFLALLTGTVGVLWGAPVANTTGPPTGTSYATSARITADKETAREIRSRYAQTGVLSSSDRQALRELESPSIGISPAKLPGTRFTYTAYPQNADYWTGSTTDSLKTQTSLVKGVAYEVGWFMFDISGIPAGSTITSVRFNGYVNNAYWPWWSLTPVSFDPRTAPAHDLFNDIVAESTSGYLYQEENADFAVGWKQYNLNESANTQLQAALTQGWFAMGMFDVDFTASLYICFDGWNETNRPYLTIEYTEVTTYPWAEGFEAGFVKLANAAGNTTDWALDATLFTEGVQSAYNPYQVSSINTLVSIPFDLSGSTNPILKFDHIAKVEANYDHCYVEISTNGGSNWVILPQSAYRGSGSYIDPLYNYPEGPCFMESSYATWLGDTPANSWWKTETFSLADYQAFSNVLLRFRLKSDVSVQYYGWLIDNVQVKESTTYAFSLTLPEDSTALIGGSHDYSVTIQNTGADQDDFAPAVIGDGLWTYDIYLGDGATPYSSPITILPGGSAWFIIRVTVPASGVIVGDTDTQNFSVTSSLGMAVQNFSLTTTAVGSIPGDTIADAWIIPSLPFTANGSTVGFSDNYGNFGQIPELVNLVNTANLSYYPDWTLGASPDVVYQLTLAEPTLLSIDLLGSQFDTSLALVTAPGTGPADVILINDDYWYEPVAFVSYVNSGCNYVPPGTYYIIIGGYDYYSGAYTLTVTAAPPPVTPEVTVQVDTATDQLILSWVQTAGMTYTIYSDYDPLGSFDWVEATGVDAAQYIFSPIPEDNTFYRVTEKFCFPGTRSPIPPD